MCWALSTSKQRVRPASQGRGLQHTLQWSINIEGQREQEQGSPSIRINPKEDRSYPPFDHPLTLPSSRLGFTFTQPALMGLDHSNVFAILLSIPMLHIR